MAKILTLIPYKVYPANLGGQKGIALFYKYLSRYHHISCVSVKDNDPALANYEMKNVISNSRFRYINIYYFFLTKKLIRQLDISTFIVEHPYFGWLGIMLKKACGINMIVHSHNIESLRFKSIGKWWWKILWYYEKWVHFNADHTFCKTEEDRQYFIYKYGINFSKCHVITYGLEWNRPPDKAERKFSKNILLNKYGIPKNTLLYLFNGTLNYAPNLQAVKNIILNINPILIKKISNYKIFICGKDIPGYLNELKEFTDQNIIFAGFVKDIDLFFKGADVFINPVVDGGGIKTKLVEALGNNMDAISCVTGAIGVNVDLCNNKLHLVANNDWENFVSKLISLNQNTNEITSNFFEHFYWDNIAKKAAAYM